MKINRLLFNNPSYIGEGKIDFSSLNFKDDRIKQIGVADVKVKGNNYDDLFVAEIEISVDVIGVCSYSLEDVLLPLHIKEKVSFSSEAEDDDELFYEPSNIIDLDEYVFSLILSSIPLRIIKEGATLPKGGNGYRVISEEEYEKEKENKKDERWNILDSIDL